MTRTVTVVKLVSDLSMEKEDLALWSFDMCKDFALFELSAWCFEELSDSD